MKLTHKTLISWGLIFLLIIVSPGIVLARILVVSSETMVFLLKCWLY